jgi:Xaa-Pro aminopeptidase
MTLFMAWGFLPCKYMDWLRDWCPRIEWCPEDGLVKSVQHVKSERELDVFREAGEISTRALNVIMEGLLAGKTEAEAASHGAAEVVRSGGVPNIIRLSHGTGEEMNNFARYPLSGADPYSAPREGDFVRAWIMGPMCHGYFLDPGRSAVCGRKPSKQQRDLLEACMSIVSGVMEKIRPGVSPHELAREGDRLTKEAGGGDTVDQAGLQWPLYGHLCDMMFENPMYGMSTCNENELIQENMVCSSEAFLAWEGVGSVGFEENLIVGKDGLEVITTSPIYWE